MSDYLAVKECIESKGGKLIMEALKRRHRKAYAEYRKCGNMEQVYYLQALQVVIDTAIPEVIEELMNKHLTKDMKRTPEWWHFWKWIRI